MNSSVHNTWGKVIGVGVASYFSVITFLTLTRCGVHSARGRRELFEKNLQLSDLRLCRQKSLPTHWPISSQSHSYIATRLAYQCSTLRVNLEQRNVEEHARLLSLAYCNSRSFFPLSSHPSPFIGVWEFSTTAFLNLRWISVNFEGLLKLLGMVVVGSGFGSWICE